MVIKIYTDEPITQNGSSNWWNNYIHQTLISRSKKANGIINLEIDLILKESLLQDYNAKLIPQRNFDGLIIFEDEENFLLFKMRYNDE